MKRTIKNLGKLDLTKYTPQALRGIRMIKKVGSITIPADASDEYYDAFSEIELRKIGAIRKIPTNGKIIEIDGFGELDKSLIDNDAIVMVDGFCIARAFDTDKPVKVCVNGFIIYDKDAPIEIIEMNGFAMRIDENLDECKIYPNSISVDKDFLQSIENGQVIIVGNMLTVKSDVTPELLKEKSPKFYVGNSVHCECSKEASGWIKANSQVGNSFI